MILSPIKVNNRMLKNPIKALKERRGSSSSHDDAKDDGAKHSPTSPSSSSSSSPRKNHAELRKQIKNTPKTTKPKKLRSMPIKIAAKWNSLLPKHANSSNNNSKQETPPQQQQHSENVSDDASKTNKSNKTKTPRVMFKEDENMVHRCLRRLSTITTSQKELLWFDNDEYENMRTECVKTVNKIEQGKQLKDKKYSQTGLESWTKDGQEERYYNKHLAWDVVMEEQYMKHQEKKLLGTTKRSSIDMSMAYQQVSKHAAERAQQTASCIHNDVQRYLSRDKEIITTTYYYNHQENDNKEVGGDAEAVEEKGGSKNVEQQEPAVGFEKPSSLEPTFVVSKSA